MRIKLSRSQWEAIGKTAGWNKTAWTKGLTKKHQNALEGMNKIQHISNSVQDAINFLESIGWNDSTYALEKLRPVIDTSIRPLITALQMHLNSMEKQPSAKDLQNLV